MRESRTDRGEEHGREQLHERVARGDRRSAVPAAATQQQPRDDRNVVTIGDPRVARRAMRRWLDDRLLARHPPDHDVQERTDDESVHAADRGDQRGHDEEG